MADKSIHTGNVSGTVVQFGDHNQATVTITQASRDEITALLEHLQKQIQQADLSAGAKQVLAEKVVPQMKEAAAAPDPKPGLSAGLERMDDHLKVLDSASGHVVGIVSTLGKIASAAGIAIKVVAPFIAGLL